MGLLSLFKREPRAPAAAGGDATQIVAAARTRAKRRLVGAVVLLGIGVIAFPLLFETQPRPIPVDIPIEIPRKDAVPTLLVPPARPASVAEVAMPASAASAVAESRPDPGAPASAAAAPPARPEPAAVAADVKVQTKPAVEAKAAADGAGRFVVQIGAFADLNVARETRGKVDKLGLHTYTQAVDTEKGKRIRVRLGPFASRDEAERVAVRVKAAGLPAAVLTL